MSRITSAEQCWHIVRVVRTSKSTLAIFDIKQITHWNSGDLYRFPMQDGKRLPFDPADDLRHVAMASYLMDPQGRLLGHEGESSLIACWGCKSGMHSHASERSHRQGRRS